MRRSTVFALAALVFLLVVLLGSWVYVANYDWPFAGGNGESTEDSDRTAKADSGEDDPFANLADPDADGGEADGGTNGPLEGEHRGNETERGNPPESVDTKRPGTETETTGKTNEDVIEAVWASGQPGVRDSSGGDDYIDPFIVSTLRPALARSGEIFSGRSFVGSSVRAHASTPVIASSKLKDIPQVPGLPYVLIGKVKWPEVEPELYEELRDAGRVQVVVYLARLPEFRFILHEKEDNFVLHMTEDMADDFGSKGLEIVVHSPAFQIEGGHESTKRKKDDGAIEIPLQLTPVFELVVDVTPPEAVTDGVRVWVERLGEPGSPDEDDSLYISAKVPESGRLHFMIPAHYGELTFGATGEHWHSGLPRKARSWGWKKTKLKLNVVLELANDPCDYVRGEVKNTARDGVKTRMQSTHFGTVTYSGSAGQFSMYVPFESSAGTRQFLATAAGYRPEVVPLENRGVPSQGVDGAPPHGPWNVTLGHRTSVRFEMPRDVLRSRDEIQVGATRVVSKGREESGATPELKWGQRLVYFKSVMGETVYVAYVSAKEWDRAFKAYAGGEEGALSIRMTSLAEAVRKR